MSEYLSPSCYQIWKSSLYVFSHAVLLAEDSTLCLLPIYHLSSKITFYCPMCKHAAGPFKQFLSADIMLNFGNSGRWRNTAKWVDFPSSSWYASLVGFCSMCIFSSTRLLQYSKLPQCLAPVVHIASQAPDSGSVGRFTSARLLCSDSFSSAGQSGARSSLWLSPTPAWAVSQQSAFSDATLVNRFPPASQRVYFQDFHHSNFSAIQLGWRGGGVLPWVFHFSARVG